MRQQYIMKNKAHLRRRKKARFGVLLYISADFVNAIAEEKQGIVCKFIDTLKSIVEAIKNYLKNGDVNHRIAAQLAQDIEALEQYEKLWVDALKAAVKNNAKMQSNAKENTDTESSGGKMSISEETDYDTPITLKDIEILRSIGRKSINQFTSEDIEKSAKWAYKFYKELGTKSPFFRAWFGDWRAKDIDPAIATSIEQKTDLNTNNRIIHNEDTKWNIQVTKNVFDDTLHYAGKEKSYLARLLTNIDDVITRAILLDTAVSIKSSENKKSSTQFMHYMYSLVEYNGNPFLAKIAVEEYGNENQHRAYNVERIKMSALSRAQYNQMKSAYRENSASNADAISISDLFSLVKQYDKMYKPKSVNPLLLNENGTPKVMYHQTSKDFTVFNTNSERAGKNDSETPTGMFFKTNDNDIGVEGSKQMAVYLNARNILEFKNRDEARSYWTKNVEGYSELQKQYDEIDKRYEKIYEVEEAKGDKWYEEHYDDLVTGKISDEEALRIMDEPLSKILEEWKSETDPIRRKQKALITNYVLKSDYDCVHFAKYKRGTAF